MNKTEAISRMIAPGTKRPGKYRQGVIQIWLTRACDKACYGCTQASNLGGNPGMITVENFRIAVESLRDYFGVVGIFGGNPALHPKFSEICEILREVIPYERRGLWCNHPKGNGKIMAGTFNPGVSNLNVHLDKEAYDEFKRDWPNSRPFGLHEDSRHSPPYVAMRDVIESEEERWDLISNCDINQHWSALIGQFRGEPRAWFCEIAGAQAMLRQHEPDYPDTGIEVEPGWWRKPIQDFTSQITYHCHRCGVPLRSYGEISQASNGVEETSKEYASIYKPKQPGRSVSVVSRLEDLRGEKVKLMTDYLGNAR